MILAISKYDAAETARWLESNDWSYPILSGGAEVIERYGLTNPNAKREERRGIPHPTTIIVDRDGVTRFVNVWVNYRERTSPETIIEELKKLHD